MFNEDKNVEEVDYTDILPSSYLDYSVSVIVDRAVPDLFDGLKPVQRRILYSMYESKFLHNRPYVKTAKVSGNVCGEYHPHGDSGVNTAIATMTQVFKKPVPFIDGQGNWGSIEGDSPAAARYTECRLTEFSEEVMMNLLDEDTVDFQPNYDNTLQEPVVLPVKVPAVLITGAEGIAVGMRTNIPTFNLSEVIDALSYVLTHKRVSIDKIVELIPAPDFASGGIICNPSDMKSLYETGEGKVRVRGKVEFEKGIGKKRDRLVITEVPYTMVGSSIINFLQDVVNLIESRDLSEVVDVVDQTGETPRLVLELAKGADVDYVLNVLYSKTKLEDMMSCNFLVVHDGKPETVGVNSILQQFAEFSKRIYTRKYKFNLKKYELRKNILEAYVTCIKDIDKVVSIVRSSRSLAEARQNLYETYSFNEDQANAVLALKISRLIGLEYDKVVKELEQVNKDILYCQSILSDENKLVRKIVSELNSIKKKYGYDRKTLVEDIPVSVSPKRVEPDKEVCVLVDRFSYVHCIDSVTYERNKEAVESDFKFNLLTSDNSKVLFMCDNGVGYRVKVKDIPLTKLRGKGVPLDNLTLNRFSTKNNSIVSVLPECSDKVVCITSSGYGKCLINTELTGSRMEFTYIPVSECDKVVYCDVPSSKYLILKSTSRRYLKCDKEMIPYKKRGSRGVHVMKFKSKSKVDSVIQTDNPQDVHPIGWFGMLLSNEQVENLL